MRARSSACPRLIPVYDDDYERHVETIRTWLDAFDNLQTIGRNGQHRYNNQDHSMVAGLYAARNVAGADLDLWSINVEQEYHEEAVDEELVTEAEDDVKKTGDRLTPTRVQEATLRETLEDAFSHYDEVALGGAVGVTASLGLAVATLVPFLGGDHSFIPMLSLLGQYLFGYEVSWPGLAVGMVEAGLVGYAFGWSIARLINRLTSAFERDLERRLAQMTTLD